MRVILLLIGTLSLLSCAEKDRTELEKDNFTLYTIDNCEYIGSKFMWSNGAYLTHKGNCSFCAKRNNN